MEKLQSRPSSGVGLELRNEGTEHSKLCQFDCLYTLDNPPRHFAHYNRNGGGVRAPQALLRRKAGPGSSASGTKAWRSNIEAGIRKPCEALIPEIAQEDTRCQNARSAGDAVE